MVLDRPRISVYYDDVLQVRMDDAEATPLLSGGASLEFWTAATPYVAAYDDFIIRPLSADDLYFTTEDSQFERFAARCFRPTMRPPMARASPRRWSPAPPTVP